MSYEGVLFGITGEIVGRFRAAIGAVVDEIRVTDVRGDGGMVSDEGEFERDGDLKGCINDTDGRLDIPWSPPRSEDFDPWTDRCAWSAGELLSEVPPSGCPRDVKLGLVFTPEACE